MSDFMYELCPRCLDLSTTQLDASEVPVRHVVEEDLRVDVSREVEKLTIVQLLAVSGVRGGVLIVRRLHEHQEVYHCFASARKICLNGISRLMHNVRT